MLIRTPSPSGNRGEQRPERIPANLLYNSAADAGAVFILRRQADGSVFKELSSKHPTASWGRRSGSAVALSGDTLAVSAPGEDSAAVGIDGNLGRRSCADAGALYLFKRAENGSWSLERYIKASNADADDQLGFQQFESGTALALRGDTLIAGADAEDSIAVGVDGDQSERLRRRSRGAGQRLHERNGATAPSFRLHRRHIGYGSRQQPLRDSRAHGRFLVAVGAPGQASEASGGVNADQSNNSTLGEAGAAYLFR